MKIQIVSPVALLAAALLLFGLVPLPAQDAEGGSGAGGGGRLAFLSPADRQHLMKVRREVFAGNPDLKTEQESLMKERQYVKNKGTGASQDDRKTLRENFLAHNEKMRAAMLQADPTIEPVLNQVQEKMKERFQQRQGAGVGDAGGAGDGQ